MAGASASRARVATTGQTDRLGDLQGLEGRLAKRREGGFVPKRCQLQRREHLMQSEQTQEPVTSRQGMIFCSVMQG